MHKHAIVVVAALLGAGCGGAVPGEEVTGVWGLALSGGCNAVMTFDAAARTYVSQVACRLSDGSLGDEFESGGVYFRDRKVTATPRRSSCPTRDHSPDVASYSRQGSTLTLVYDSGAMVFQAVGKAAAGDGSVIRFGCWSMGAFEEHPRQDL